MSGCLRVEVKLPVEIAGDDGEVVEHVVEFESDIIDIEKTQIDGKTFVEFLLYTDVEDIGFIVLPSTNCKLIQDDDGSEG